MENNENIEKTQESAVVQADNKQADDKVRAIRMSQAAFEQFKTLVSEMGVKTQGAAFQQLLSCWSLNHASSEMQEQAANVELVQTLTSQLCDLFTAQFAAMQGLERSAKNAVSLKTQELEQELAAAVAAATESDEKAKSAVAEKVDAVARAVQEAKDAKAEADAAVKDAQDAQHAAEAAQKAAEAEAKAKAAEAAKAAEQAAQAVAGLATIKQTLDELNKAKEEAEMYASKSAAANDELRKELKTAKAEAAKVAGLQERVAELKQELKDAKSELKDANKSAQSVADKLIEIEKAHSKALDELREKEHQRYSKAVEELQKKSQGEPDEKHSQANNWARSVETPNNKQ